MKTGINTEIALQYVVARKRQSIVAALGVTFGISMFIFMNSLITGTNEYFEKMTLNTTPHIRLYHEHGMSSAAMMDQYLGTKTINIISNPQLINEQDRIFQPDAIVDLLLKDKDVIAVSPQVTSNIIYSNGNVEKNGNVAGINIFEQDKMFDITSTLIAGSADALNNTPDGIIIGSGLADKLNLNKGDFITLTAVNGSVRPLRIVGIFRTTIKAIDDIKSYVNIPVVQQLLKTDRSYITDIFINIKDHTKAQETASKMAILSGYTTESWQKANEQSIAARAIRDVIANSVVITILIVAGFGIYNILNMTIYEKIKEIAILKATGFAGADVIGIFIRQALFIGIIGGLLGIFFGWLIAYAVSKMYIGVGNLDNLPVSFYAKHYLQGFGFGLVTAFFAGYIPARKASKVDPVSIIRG